jgi:hypothetical protein
VPQSSPTMILSAGCRELELVARIVRILGKGAWCCAATVIKCSRETTYGHIETSSMHSVMSIGSAVPVMARSGGYAEVYFRDDLCARTMLSGQSHATTVTVSEGFAASLRLGLRHCNTKRHPLRSAPMSTAWLLRQWRKDNDTVFVHDLKVLGRCI